ncbi:MAG: hypothetical protein LH609_20685 [Rudanella sp.]|nr:hypothetical protein [Rudanella sp.]
MKTSTKIITDLRTFLDNAARNPAPYRQKEQDFTRNSKLNFAQLAGLILTLLKSPYRLN